MGSEMCIRDRSSAAQRVGRQDGGSGNFMHIEPNSFDDNFCPLSSKISIAYPGKETVGEPFLIGSNSIPVGFAAIGQPVSVCHQ